MFNGIPIPGSFVCADTGTHVTKMAKAERMDGLRGIGGVSFEWRIAVRAPFGYHHVSQYKPNTYMQNALTGGGGEGGVPSGSNSDATGELSRTISSSPTEFNDEIKP